MWCGDVRSRSASLMSISSSFGVQNLLTRAGSCALMLSLFVQGRCEVGLLSECLFDSLTSYYV